MEATLTVFQGRRRHAESCSPYFSVFKACDLPRGLDSVGLVYLAIAVLGEPQLAVSYGGIGMSLVARDGARRRAVTAPMRYLHLPATTGEALWRA